MNQRSYLPGILAVLLLVAGGRAGETPHIFWASDSVLPGETVVLQGADFGTNTVVEFRPGTAAPNGAWTRAEILQRSADNLKAVLPADWPMGVFACRTVDLGNPVPSAVWWLNAPEGWWVQGDAGETATPGGWLRVCGRNLIFGGLSTARLVDESNREMSLEATNADGYALGFTLPLNLKPGAWRVEVHNGLPGTAPWRGGITVRPAPAWPTNVFSVVESLGRDAAREMRKTLVKYREVKDATAGIQAALGRARQNGGGHRLFSGGALRHHQWNQGAAQDDPARRRRGVGGPLVGPGTL